MRFVAWRRVLAATTVAQLAAAAPAPAQRTYDLTGRYPAGEALAVTLVAVQPETPQAGDGKGASLRDTVSLRLEVDKPGGAGSAFRLVLAGRRRVRSFPDGAEVLLMDAVSGVQKATPARDALDRRLNALRGVRLSGKIAADAGLSVTKGAADAAAALAKADADGPESPERRRALAAELVNALRQAAEQGFAYLPGRPAAVGDEWRVQRRLPYLGVLAGTAAAEENVTCRFSKLRSTFAGAVAVIELSGSARVVPPGAEKPIELAVGGLVTFSIPMRSVLTHRLELRGRNGKPGGVAMTISVTQWPADTLDEAADRPTVRPPHAPATSPAPPSRRPDGAGGPRH